MKINLIRFWVICKLKIDELLYYLKFESDELNYLKKYLMSLQGLKNISDSVLNYLKNEYVKLLNYLKFESDASCWIELFEKVSYELMRGFENKSDELLNYLKMYLMSLWMIWKSWFDKLKDKLLNYLKIWKFDLMNFWIIWKLLTIELARIGK